MKCILTNNASHDGNEWLVDDDRNHLLPSSSQEHQEMK
jgi:hypothetical protein